MREETTNRDELMRFLHARIADARRNDTARHSSAETWSTTTDEEWEAAGGLTRQMTGKPAGKMSKADREKQAAMELRIAAKLRREIELLEQITAIVASKGEPASCSTCAKLLKTADGVLIVPDLPMWYSAPSGSVVEIRMCHGVVARFNRELSWLDPKLCYISRDAAIVGASQ